MTISFPNETWTSRSRVETAKRKKRPVFADIRSIKAKTKVFSGNLLAPRGMLAVTCYTRSSVFQSFFVKLNHSIPISTLIETQTIFHPVQKEAYTASRERYYITSKLMGLEPEVSVGLCSLSICELFPQLQYEFEIYFL